LDGFRGGEGSVKLIKGEKESLSKVRAEIFLGVAECFAWKSLIDLAAFFKCSAGSHVLSLFR